MKPIKIDPREHKVVKSLPAGMTCFGCSDGPTFGLGLRAYRTEDGCVVAKLRTKLSHASFPGVIHGGIVASYFDELLWYNTWKDDFREHISMTAEMNVKYFAPVPAGVDITIVGDPAEVDGRHLHINGRIILEDGTVAATARAHFIIINKPADEGELEEPPRPVYGEDMESFYF